MAGGSIPVTELLTPENWESFLHTGKVLLILSNSRCTTCEEWKLELSQWESTQDIRIAEIKLDQPRFGRFKSMHQWIADITILPFNTIFIEGEVIEQWSGNSLTHLEERLLSIMS